MSAPGPALFELLARYARIWRHAWRIRHELDPPRLRRHESEFLPAALALRDTPVHPAPRAAMMLIVLFALLTVLWAVFGRVDIVASAPGRLIPNDRSKVVQATETASVRALHVRDGQRVHAGDLLIELDATQTRADVARIEADALTARLEAARARAMIEAMEQGRPARLPAIDGAGPDRLTDEQRLLDSQHAELRARLARLDAEILRREAEQRAIGEWVDKLRETLPITRQRARDYQGLLEQNFVSRHGWLEREQVRIEQERDLAAQLARLDEIRAALLEARRQRESLLAETRRATLDLRHQAEQRAVALRQELIKAQARDRLMRLTAPVSGIVQQLAVHTVGGVVTPAQPLLVIVPDDDPLEVEAILENKDVGFVRAGQTAEVKVETFPFTKYGTLHAVVAQVSGDAIQDEQRGLVYAARLHLRQATIDVDGMPVRLAPGMAVTAEVKTGRRRVIEYFLGPLLQVQAESLRER